MGRLSVRVLVDGIGDAQPILYSIIPETSLHFVQEAPLHFQLGFGLSRGQFQPVYLDETQRTIKGIGKIERDSVVPSFITAVSVSPERAPSGR